MTDKKRPKMDALTSAREIEKAFNTMRAQMQRGAVRVWRKFGSTGWSTDARRLVLWRQKEGIWCWLGSPRDKRLGGAYGLQNPQDWMYLTALVEVNFNKRPPFRCSSRFARAGSGVYLVREGRVSDQTAVPVAEFRRAFRGWQWVNVTLANGRSAPHVMVGRIGAVGFPAALASFVRAVHDFKQGRGDEEQTERRPPTGTVYKPEFEGKTLLPPRGEARVTRRHGTVVNELWRLLSERKTQVLANGAADYINDRRDLVEMVGSGRSSRARTIYEVKTGRDWYSIYTGIGQLMLHGAALPNTPRRVLVIPARPDGNTADALRKLGLRVLSYRWRRGKPVFANLDEVLK